MAGDPIMMIGERVLFLGILLHTACVLTTLAFRCCGMLSVVDVPWKRSLADNSAIMFSERVLLMAMLLRIACGVTILAFRCCSMFFSIVDFPRVRWRVFL